MTYTAVESYINPYQTLLDAGYSLRQAHKIHSDFADKEPFFLSAKLRGFSFKQACCFVKHNGKETPDVMQQFLKNWDSRSPETAIYLYSESGGHRESSRNTSSPNADLIYRMKDSLEVNILRYGKRHQTFGSKEIQEWAIHHGKKLRQNSVAKRLQEMRQQGKVVMSEPGMPLIYSLAAEEKYPCINISEALLYQAYNYIKTVDMFETGDIAEALGKAPSTITEIKTVMKKRGLIVQSGKVGRRKLHKWTGKFMAEPAKKITNADRIYERLVTNKGRIYTTVEMASFLDIQIDCFYAAIPKLLTLGNVEYIKGRSRRAGTLCVR